MRCYKDKWENIRNSFCSLQGEMILYKSKVLSHYSNTYKWSNTSYQIKIKYFHSISTLEIELVGKGVLGPEYPEFFVIFRWLDKGMWLMIFVPYA